MRNRIRVLRAERRWTQAELADRLGVSRQTVNAIENDRYDPSLPLAFRISEVFDRSIHDIFDAGHDDEGSGDHGNRDRRAREDRAREVGPGEDRPGEVGPGEVGPGEDRPGEGRLGEDRSGRGRS